MLSCGFPYNQRSIELLASFPCASFDPSTESVRCTMQVHIVAQGGPSCASVAIWLTGHEDLGACGGQSRRLGVRIVGLL